MHVTHLSNDLIPKVIDLLKLGAPFIRTRTHSDYWLYAQLFSSTCPIAILGGDVVGAVIAFRSQENPEEGYIQDVMTHPDHRRAGIARTLLDTVRTQARHWGCTLIYLTSEPDNTTAHMTWNALGFTNRAADNTVNGVAVTADFKGPGHHRAVYDLTLP